MVSFNIGQNLLAFLLFLTYYSILAKLSLNPTQLRAQLGIFPFDPATHRTLQKVVLSGIFLVYKLQGTPHPHTLYTELLNNNNNTMFTTQK